MGEETDLPIGGKLTPEHLPAIYAALAERLPDEAIQRVSAAENPRNFPMTGCKYQFVVNRFNEVLGVDHWHMTSEVLFDGFAQPDGSGGKMREVLMRVTISLGNWSYELSRRYASGDGIEVTETGPTFETIHFIPLAMRSGYGGNANTSRADAYKGALTDTFKKVAAFFGVGREAYEQTIDQEFRPQKRQGVAQPSTQRRSSPPSGGAAESPPAAANGSKDTMPLRKAVAGACDQRKLNRYSVLARTFRTVSTADLRADELTDLLAHIQNGEFSQHPTIGTDKANLQQGVNDMAMYYCQTVGVDEDSITQDIESLLADAAKSRQRTNFEKLTKDELREVAAELRTKCLQIEDGKQKVQALKRVWWEALRADLPNESESALAEQAKKGLNHFAAQAFEKQYEDLFPAEVGTALLIIQRGGVDILSGDLKPGTETEELF